MDARACENLSWLVGWLVGGSGVVIERKGDECVYSLSSREKNGVNKSDRGRGRLSKYDALEKYLGKRRGAASTE